MLQYSRCEINCTLRCNLRCTNCNRMPHLFESEDTDILLDDLMRFVQQTSQHPLVKVKLLGGEPLLHKSFSDVYDVLLSAVKQGHIGELKIDHNHTIVPPDGLCGHPRVRWMGRRPSRKKHLPVMWSPLDLGHNIPSSFKCPALTRCGFSLDYRGYLPCSPAIAIVRVFGWDDLYRTSAPSSPWGLDRLCQHCVMSMPEEWKREHCHPIANTPSQALQPTLSYQKRLT
jgi:hypothetical protein